MPRYAQYLFVVKNNVRGEPLVVGQPVSVILNSIDHARNYAKVGCIPWGQLHSRAIWRVCLARRIAIAPYGAFWFKNFILDGGFYDILPCTEVRGVCHTLFALILQVCSIASLLRIRISCVNRRRKNFVATATNGPKCMECIGILRKISANRKIVVTEIKIKCVTTS